MTEATSIIVDETEKNENTVSSALNDLNKRIIDNDIDISDLSAITVLEKAITDTSGVEVATSGSTLTITVEKIIAYLEAKKTALETRISALEGTT